MRGQLFALFVRGLVRSFLCAELLCARGGDRFWIDSRKSGWRLEHDRKMIGGTFGDDRRLGRAGYAPVWGLDRDLLKKRHFFAKIVEMSMIEG